jgi:TolB protein
MTNNIFFMTYLRPLFAIFLVSTLGLMTPLAHAALTIEIVGAGANQIPNAIAPFRIEEQLAQQQLTPIIGADLVRSGLFKTVDPGGVVPMPYEPDQVNYGQWKTRGAEALVIGTVASAGDRR